MAEMDITNKVNTCTLMSTFIYILFMTIISKKDILYAQFSQITNHLSYTLSYTKILSLTFFQGHLMMSKYHYIFKQLNNQMGCQSSVQKLDIQPPISSLKDIEDRMITTEQKLFIDVLYSKVNLISKINERLNCITFATQDLFQLAEAVIETIEKICDNETPQEKNVILQIFTPELSTLISEQKVDYKDIQQLLKKQKPLLKEVNKSRIYHTIANLKYSNQCYRYTKSEQNSIMYNKLNQEEMDQLVTLEHIAHHSIHLSHQFKFKYQSMQEQHKEINSLLSNCFAQYAQTIGSFKYQLQEEQILKAAHMSRKACEYHQNGIYLLIIYFIKSFRKLERNGEEVANIQAKMKKAIDKISAIYPPGEGLQGDKEQLRTKMESITINGKFTSQPIKISKDNKGQQLRDIIIKQAQLAYKNKQDFVHLIRSTCLKRSVAYKAGLKLNPNNINQKAMIRIQQKMFFKGKEIKRAQQINIKNTLITEDREYQIGMEKQLENLQEIHFSISDMVRAKCTFLNLEDIISTIMDIKTFVDAENDKIKGKYRIVEVQSRFTRQPPISDISLKIALNEEIVAELQLTLQTNLAAYNFAHKIYEFSRSKIFSKVKIIYNYYEEYKNKFNELIKRILHLKDSDSSKDSLMNHTKIIKSYFQISQNIEDPSSTWKKVIYKRLGKRQLLSNILNFDDKRYFLINILFSMINNSQQQSVIGQLKDYFKRNQCSWIYESVIMLQNLREVYVQTKMQGTKKQNYQFRYSQIFEKDLYPNLQFRQKLLCEEIKCYSKRTFKLFQQFQFNIDTYYNLFQYVSSPHLIYGPKDNRYIEMLIQASKFKYKSKHYDQQENYLNQALMFWREVDYKQNSESILRIQLELANSYMEVNKTEQAEKLILLMLPVFKQKQQKDRVIQCSLFQAECYVKKNMVKQFKEHFQKVSEISKVMNISLVGQKIARCFWRIGLELRRIAQQTQDKDLNKYALDIHFRNALSEFGNYENFEQLQKYMSLVWNGYKQLGLSEPILKANLYKTVEINMNPYEQRIYQLLTKINWPNLKKMQMKFVQCEFLMRVNWPNMQSFSAEDNGIGDKGCEFIGKVKWSNLQTLSLRSNGIEEKGIQFISSAHWPNLKAIYLGTNNIGPKGVKHLSKANWPNLRRLYLSANLISNEGLQHLSKAHFPLLIQLQLKQNNIQAPGIKHLSTMVLSNLTYLGLSQNYIGQKALQYFSQMKLPALQRLDFERDLVGSEGLEYLVKMDLPRLKWLNLMNANIGDKGCQGLAKSPWKCLQQLFLQMNNFGQKGAQQLIKAQWPKLRKLNLGKNKLNEKGIETLRKANWPNLKEMNLWQTGISNIQAKNAIKLKFKNVTLIF